MTFEEKVEEYGKLDTQIKDLTKTLDTEKAEIKKYMIQSDMKEYISAGFKVMCVSSTTEKMNEAAAHLFDYTDFTSFSKLHTDTKTNNCKIMYARWEQTADGGVFTIKADRFLRNMVRAIVGTLIEVGRGAITINEFCKIIEKKDRCAAGSSMPGNALFLTDIEYSEDIFI